MQNPWVFAHLVAWMENNAAPPEAIEAFRSRWLRLRDHDRLPCPSCFMQEEEHPLAAFRAVGEVEPLICAYCHTQYSIPVGR
jgi:uncharacterized Zn-finger protein